MSTSNIIGRSAPSERTVCHPTTDDFTLRYIIKDCLQQTQTKPVYTLFSLQTTFLQAIEVKIT